MREPICVQRNCPRQGHMLAQCACTGRAHLNAELALFRFAECDHVLLAVIVVAGVLAMARVLSALMLPMALLIVIVVIIVAFGGMTCMVSV
jgi:hypothetical protein